MLSFITKLFLLRPKPTRIIIKIKDKNGNVRKYINKEYYVEKDTKRVI